MGVRIRSIAKKRWKLAGAFTSLMFFGGVAWVGTDRVVSSIFESLRPELEEELSIPLGHPLKLGAYRGLRPWGLAIGQSEILKGPKDDSTGTFSSVRIAFAPFASFLHWRPVVRIDVKGAFFNLKRNQKGSYWIPGEVKGGSLPKVDVRFGFTNPAKVSLAPSNLEVFASARGQAHFATRQVGGMLKLTFPDRGRVFLQAQGNWDEFIFNTRARFKDVKLRSLQELFVGLPFDSQGNLNGDFRIALGHRKIGCSGGLSLADFIVKSSSYKQSISSPFARVNCTRDSLVFNRSKWVYGSLTSDLGGDLYFNSSSKSSDRFSGLIRLSTFGNNNLNIKASLPVHFKQDGFGTGEISAALDVRSMPLGNFSEITGVPMGGHLTAAGELNGALSSMKADLAIQLEKPQLSFLRLQENWQGEFLGSPQGGGSLKMKPVGDVIPGSLVANFGKSWDMNDLKINRADGLLSVTSYGQTGDYRWKADFLKLDGLEFALPPNQRFERFFGNLSGEGIINTNRASINGQFKLGYPRMMGLELRKAVLEGSYEKKNFSLNGGLFPPDVGEVTLTATGTQGKGVKANASARGLSAKWLALSALQLPRINIGASPEIGDAKDLGTFLVDTFGGSIDGQLRALSASKSFLREIDERNNKRILNPQDLQGHLDADINVQGTDLSNLNLALTLKGHIWTNKTQGNQAPKEVKPFIATLKGPIQSGGGSFSLLNIPFSLLSLIAPIPSTLSGGIGLSGTYQKRNSGLSVTADFVLSDAILGQTPLLLDRGKFSLSDSLINLDIALRNSVSTEPVTLKGDIPLVPELPMDLRLESHGDGLRALSEISNGQFGWKSGTSHLRLLISGPFKNPQANGYLVVEDSEVIINEQLITGLNTSMIFDFDRLEMQRLDGKVGPNGTIRGNGSIALFKPSIETKPLAFNLQNVRLKLPVADTDVSGKLILTRALLTPTFGGELTVNDGSISPGKSDLVKTSSGLINQNKVSMKEEGRRGDQEDYSTPSFIEKTWDFQEPLVLLGRDVEAKASKMLRSFIPNVSSLSFDNLRLRLGPELRITAQPLINFRVAGFVTLNGALGPSLQPRGVVRLLNGRVNLFTTTFNLDRKAPNVAVFTPSLGLIPYVDVTLKSRVAESVNEGSNLTSTEISAANGTGPFGSGGFRLIKVMVQATGPADRIAENIKLRSSPPMPRAQLLGLIGGNTLAGLSGGGDSEMIATVLGRSLLSPVLGIISDSFSDRIQLSLYPTYVTPEVEEKSNDVEADSQEELTGQSPPQQAWVTEIGIDLTEKFNFSVLAAPNRDDIPPQGTLTYQVTENLGVAGSLDNEGTWQSQFQLFFRF